MWQIILFVILSLTAVGLLTTFKRMGAAAGLRLIPLGIFALAFLILVTSFFTAVPAKTVGVITTFGRVSESTLSPGLNFKFPWQKVVKIDATRQTDEYASDNVIEVRIGDGSTAYVETAIRWEINPEYANTVYQDFRSDDPTQSFKQAIITTELRSATQKVLARYNPIAQLKAVEGEETNVNLSFAPDYDATAQAMEDEMIKRLGSEPLANIISVSVSYVGLSKNTQSKLDDYIAEVGDTRVAQQRTETAKAQAAANKELSASVSKDPNVLVSKCYDLVADSVKSKYQLPAGFSCWPGSSNGLVLGQTTPQPKN